MTELSDYKRLVEKPHLETLDRMIRNQVATIASMRLVQAELVAELQNLLDCIDLAARNGETILPFAGYGQVHLDKARAAIAKATSPTLSGDR